MLTVIRIGLPDRLRRSLGCTNAIQRLMAAPRKSAGRQTLARRTDRIAMDRHRNSEAEKSFRRLKAHKQLPI